MRLTAILLTSLSEGSIRRRFHLPCLECRQSFAEAQKAYSIKAEPLYKHQEGKINYLKKDYQKAYDLFMELTKTPMNSARYGMRQPKLRVN